MAGGGNAGLVQALQVRGCAAGGLMFGWRQRLHTALPAQRPALPAQRPSSRQPWLHCCCTRALQHLSFLRYNRLSLRSCACHADCLTPSPPPAAPPHPLQRGLANMLGQSSGFIESLPVPVRSWRDCSFCAVL